MVDKDNTAGFGAGAVVAFYTTAGENQTQSMAYSTDNGKTFTKYDGNPILTADVPDFRDPHVFRHEKERPLDSDSGSRAGDAHILFGQPERLDL